MSSSDGLPGPHVVLVLTARPENFRLLSELFGSKYDWRTERTLDPETHDFDLCLIDASLIDTYDSTLAARKAAQPDVLTPVIGLVPRGEATDDLVGRFDEVLHIPCLKNELRHRIEISLHARRLSLDNRRLLTQLRGRVNDLESEVEDQRASERHLALKTAAAESANRTKSAFLANMSHEIRTPLGVILGFNDLLRNEDLSRADRLIYVDTIERSGRSLTRIIDDILDLAKVEAGKVVIESVPVDLRAVVDECVAMFADQAAQKSLYLTATYADDLPTTIASDPTRLRQVLVNLIGNAIKFTAYGGVTVHVKPGGDRMIGVTVRDTGIGLSSAQQATLFRAFVQADDSTTRKFGGTGLGLVLSRRLAEALGGTITIGECALGKGCTFVFTFEGRTRGAVPPASPEAEQPANPHAYIVGKRVLAVDDSPDNLFLIQHLLRSAGAVVETAAGGQEAIDLCAKHAFDLVLLDIQMPDLDGYETIRRLRSAGRVEPIVALTAHAMAEERTRTAAAGFNGHVTKPIQATVLHQTLRKLMNPGDENRS